MKTNIHSSLITIHCLLVSTMSIFAQGSLTPPPGPPAPTMKTLDQVEPRIDLQNAPRSAVDTGAPAYHYVISQPGSYYLSANLGVTKTNGIQINTEGVTLDLNGFEISRASGSGGNGIEIAAASHRARLRNGSVKGFTYGVHSLFSGSYPLACAFRDLSVSNCTFGGIEAGFGAVLESCQAHDISGGFGIYADWGASLTNCAATNNTVSASIWTNSGASLSNCVARNNTATYGIRAGGGSSLTNCTATGNTSAATTSAGIKIFGTGATISHCTAAGNSSTAGTSTPTTGMGFSVDGASNIHDCTADGNKGDGINIGHGTLVRDNSCSGNGNGGNGAGIHATNADNRIVGNNVVSNDRGIDVDLAGNFISRNSASGNTTNWDVVAGNVILVVNANSAGAVTGNSGGTAPGSTDPNANFSY